MTSYPPSITPRATRPRSRAGIRARRATTGWWTPRPPSTSGSIESYPQFYLPVADVDPELLADPALSPRLRRHPDLPDHVRIRWDALDHWFEEEEEVFGPPAQPVCPRRRPALDPARPDRARRGPAGRVARAGAGLRDRAAHPLLRRPQRPRPRPPRAVADRDRMSLQGPDHGVLVGPHRGPSVRRPGLELRLPHQAAAPDRRARRVLRREGGRGPRRRAQERPVTKFS